MTPTTSAVGPTVSQRWRTARWVVLGLVVITAVAVAGAVLTGARPGGRMDPESTSPAGAHALVALLRDHGVDVTVAGDIAAVERSARPDSLVVLAQTFNVVGADRMRRLADVPGDRLLVEPGTRAREELTADIRLAGTNEFGGKPDCTLREATRAGDVQFEASDTYESATGVSLTSCYDGAVVRYTAGDRTVTVVGTADFLVNSGLTKQGNAALAMNLAGTRPHVVWYAPQRVEGESDGDTSIFDLIPDNVSWIVWQLCLTVVLVAVWKGRRVGPLVAEQLPVVVRASETVEGRGRLYRSHRARDRAADALRTAALQRLRPRLGLGANASPAAVAQAVAGRLGGDPAAAAHPLFGPPPATDADLVHLARALDDIERQVAQS